MSSTISYAKSDVQNQLVLLEDFRADVLGNEYIFKKHWAYKWNVIALRELGQFDGLNQMLVRPMELQQ